MKDIKGNGIRYISLQLELIDFKAHGLLRSINLKIFIYLIYLIKVMKLVNKPKNDRNKLPITFTELVNIYQKCLSKLLSMLTECLHHACYGIF